MLHYSFWLQLTLCASKIASIKNFTTFANLFHCKFYLLYISYALHPALSNNKKTIFLELILKFSCAICIIICKGVLLKKSHLIIFQPNSQPWHNGHFICEWIFFLKSASYGIFMVLLYNTPLTFNICSRRTKPKACPNSLAKQQAISCLCQILVNGGSWWRWLIFASSHHYSLASDENAPHKKLHTKTKHYSVELAMDSAAAQLYLIRCPKIVHCILALLFASKWSIRTASIN